MTTRAQDYELPVDPNKLGCIMLDLGPLPVVKMLPADTGYYFDDHLPWVKGPVAEVGAHITLLYGLVDVDGGPSAADARAGQAYRYYAEKLLEDIEIEDQDFQATEFDSFDNPEKGYSCIVMRFDSNTLAEANRRLRFLPHVDTFADYKQHATLAYVQYADRDRCLDALAERMWANLSVRAHSTAINYGGELD